MSTFATPRTPDAHTASYDSYSDSELDSSSGEGDGTYYAIGCTRCFDWKVVSLASRTTSTGRVTPSPDLLPPTVSSIVEACRTTPA